MNEIASLLGAQPASLAAYLILGLAVLSLWVARSPAIWGSLLGLSALFAFLADRLAPTGLLLGAGFLALVHLYFRPRKKFKWVWGLLLSVLALGLGSHLLPGFRNWKVLEAAVSAGAPAIPLYLNFDKAFVGIALLGMGSLPLSRPRQFLEVSKSSLRLIFIACLTLLGLALFSHSVALDLKWPSFAPLWLAVNLLFVCVAEEAFFRGFLQRELCALFDKYGFGNRSFKLGGYKAGHLLGWVMASVLFGFAHYRGGVVYMGVSAVAGLFYGAGLLKTQRIEASILTHFVVNAIHFLAFTYPFLTAP